MNNCFFFSRGKNSSLFIYLHFNLATDKNLECLTFWWNITFWSEIFVYTCHSRFIIRLLCMHFNRYFEFNTGAANRWRDFICLQVLIQNKRKNNLNTITRAYFFYFKAYKSPINIITIWAYNFKWWICSRMYFNGHGEHETWYLLIKYTNEGRITHQRPYWKFVSTLHLATTLTATKWWPLLKVVKAFLPDTLCLILWC